MKAKIFKINDNHICKIRQYHDDLMLICIEQIKSGFWGKSYKRVSEYRLFKFDDDPWTTSKGTPRMFGLCREMYVNNHYYSLTENIRNLPTFDLKSEIDTLYDDYLKSLKMAENKSKLIDNIFNSLD